MMRRAKRPGSSRLANKNAIFKILQKEPDLSASQLLGRASQAGIELSLIAAYRAVKAYRTSGGKLEESENKSFRLVSSILQSADQSEHLSCEEIVCRARKLGSEIHQATVYRVLARLSEIGLISAIDSGRQRFYEWRREDIHHGHLTCVLCGKTVEFYQDYLDEVGRQVCNRLGYEFAGMEFVVRSVCLNCRD